MDDWTPKKHTWSEFRDSGLLWFINTILHIFGWAIVLDMKDDEVKAAYPARVRYRGFDSDTNDKGYKRVNRFMMNNAKTLYDEAKYEGENDGKDSYQISYRH